MIQPLRKLAAVIVLALVTLHCGNDAAIRGQACSSDGDCPSGSVCQVGRCTEVSGPGVGGDSDASEGDLGPADAAPDAGGEDVPLSDAAGENLDLDVSEDTSTGDGGETNACGGNEPLEGEPGDDCGECLDGELVCEGTDALSCSGASEPNLCGGCGPLVSLPGLPCGDCGDGQWRCVDTELICDCDVAEPDGTCATPFPIELGDVVQVDLCGAGHEISPQDDGDDCETVELTGEDVVYSFTLEAPSSVRIDLRDDDPEVAIDTVVYLRSTCADDDNQVACDDDVPCNDSDIVTGGCSGDVQVRQSRLGADLEAGTYFLVADSFNYAQFTCGTVRLEILGE